LDRFGLSTGGASSSLSITTSPWKRWRRSISVAAKPAAPPPTITIFCGPPGASTTRRLGAGAAFPRTKTLPPSTSVDQHAMGPSAGALTASPVRKLKHAWCHGQRTVSSTISPSASGPP